VGDTWVADFVRLNALQPLPLPGRGKMKGVDVFSVPWSMDTHVIFYRRDMLEKAGVDEAQAFTSLENLENTLTRLLDTGIAIPLSIATKSSRVAVHNLATWVWTASGDFLSPDGSQVVFDSAQALEGLKSYFRLGRYLGVTGRKLEEFEADQLMWQGKAAVTVSGYWMLGMPKDILSKTGVVRMPGVPFAGGENIVIWQHSRQKDTAEKLLQFITESQRALSLYPLIGLPVREEGWQQPSFVENPVYAEFRTSLRAGRSLPTDPLWGLVEKRLVDTVAQIWLEVFRSPEKSDAIVESSITSLADSIRYSIKS
jgi:multiple sugar transport system substrate-binding protein